MALISRKTRQNAATLNATYVVEHTKMFSSGCSGGLTRFITQHLKAFVAGFFQGQS
jgi:hypothetical protein